MPGCITHMLAARNIYKELKNEELSALLIRNYEAYLWGSQGPDLLMHTGFLPWHRISNLMLIGGRMHKEGVGETFQRFYDYAKKRENEKEFETLFAYMMGYITHYIIDRSFHPYVYYFVYYFKGLNTTLGETRWHYKIEENLDVALLQWIYEESPYEFSAFNVLKLLPNIYTPISHMISEVMDKRFGRSVKPGEIINSFKDMYFVQRFLYNPKSIKGKTVNLIERLARKSKSGGLSFMVHRRRLDKNYDYCNLNAREWFNPYNHDQKSTMNTYELFEKAVTETAKMQEDIFTAFKNDKKNIIDIVGNVSMNSGLTIVEGKRAKKDWKI